MELDGRGRSSAGRGEALTEVPWNRMCRFIRVLETVEVHEGKVLNADGLLYQEGCIDVTGCFLTTRSACLVKM